MPAIVTASQLRTVLGVSVSLYNDTYLDEIINTSEAVILPMLVANTSGVRAYKLESNVATYYTQRPHYFVAGQSIVVTGLPAPFTATIVSRISAIKECNSGVSKATTGCAVCNKRVSPILSISRIVMLVWAITGAERSVETI